MKGDLILPYPTFSLFSDRIKRSAVYRDPGTTPPDAVIWLHGGNGNATDFLNGIRRRSNVIDVVPQGLLTAGTLGWVHPWEGEADLPCEAPDNLIDVWFMSALEAHVRCTFRSVTRVWLCGFSAGGGLVWAVWALKGTIPHSFSGLCAVGKKLHHKRENGWNWTDAAKAPIPFAMVNGVLDDPDHDVNGPRTNYSWVDSYAEARAVNGNTVNVSATPRHLTCCGSENYVGLKVASGGDAPSARYTVDGVGHVWQSCPDCHTDDLVIDRFTAFGLGSADRK